MTTRTRTTTTNISTQLHQDNVYCNITSVSTRTLSQCDYNGYPSWRRGGLHWRQSSMKRIRFTLRGHLSLSLSLSLSPLRLVQHVFVRPPVLSPKPPSSELTGAPLSSSRTRHVQGGICIC